MGNGDNSITQEELKELLSKHKTGNEVADSGYRDAINDALAAISAKNNASAAVAEAARKANLISGKGNEASDIYDNLKAVEDGNAPHDLRFDVTFGSGTEDGYPTIAESSAHTIDDAITEFYSYAKRYGPLAVNGKKILIIDRSESDDQATVVAEYSNGSFSSDEHSFYCV